MVWVGYEVIVNARANLDAQHITPGFKFLDNNAGFDISQTLIPYSGSDSYARVLAVGLLNTLLVSVIGIVFATILGFIVALGRLSSNWLLSRVAGTYVEIIRNLPLLFQILFWYIAVLSALPRAAAEHLAVRRLLSQRAGPHHSAAAGRVRLVAIPRGADRRYCCLDCAACLCAARVVRERPGAPHLALCPRSPDWSAARHMHGVRSACRLRDAGAERASTSPGARASFRNSWR